MGVIRTVKAKGRKTLKTQDDSRRARELSRILGSLIGDADLVCAESLSIPFVPGKGGAGKVAAVKAAVQTATCWGVIVAHCQRERKELRENTPQVVKKKVTGRGNASKDEVRAAMAARFGAASLEGVIQDTPRSQHDHAYDALATALACVTEEELRALLTL